MSERKIPPAMYKSLGRDHKLVKGMSQAKFILWVSSIYSTAYTDGWDACVDKYRAEQTSGNIIVPEDVDAAVVDADDLLRVLRGVKGIGPVLAGRIYDVLTREETTT